MNNCENFRLATAYIVWQMSDFTNLYDPDEALCHGTVFPEMNLPLLGTKGECANER